jgi:PAS domain S-box-containing protein
VDSSEDAIVSKTLDGIIRSWNAAAERVFGYRKDEVLGMMPPFEPILPPAARGVTEMMLSRLRAGDMTAHSVNENLTKDGRTITCEWNNTPLFDPSGAFSGVLSLVQDVSERHRAERALRASEERFRQITESISEVFWLRSLETGEVEYVSPAYERVWGRSREELSADPLAWAAPVHAEDRERVLRAALRQGTAGYDEEYRIVRPDGGVRWIRDRAFPVRADDGSVVRIAGVAEDTTEQRTLETQLRQAQKMEAMGQLAAGIAHDFNNLLTVIIGSSELLLECGEDAEGQRFLATEIKRAGERSAALTRQLLAFSRQQVIAPRVLDLNAVVRDTETMLRRVIAEDVALVTELGAGLPSIKADPGQIEQLLLNLVVNARDAMPEGGRLTISTRAVAASADAGPQAVIAVSDTGCGMSDAVKRRLFEPFFTTKPAGKGTGLGLSVVHGVVKQNNGRIEVASAPARGTTFTILLPGIASPAPPRVEEQAPPLAAAAANGTILLVEDEDSLRRLTRRTLDRAGYHVLEARRGAEAVAIAERGPIDLLMTDMVMPDMSGRDVAARITGRHPGIRVLFVSGYTADTLPHAGAPVTHFLEKPFSSAAIARKVREVLAAAV